MKQIKCLAAALAAAVLLLLTAVAAGAQTPSPTVVRVGFPIQAGISEVDENGEYTGYLVDYLEQLCLFTGWEIEYVQAEGDINTQLTTLLGQLQNGEIDLMGTMNRSEALEEMFLYPNRSYGSSYSVLAVREDSPYAAEDFSGWDGIRVATYPRMINGMELLEEYARSHGFTYETIEYQTSEEMLEAVYSGEADAVVQVDISLPDGLRSIGQFAPNPYYLALAPQREDLLPDLNAGLEILSRTYVHLEQELYETYFLDSGAEFIPSEENLAYIESLGTVRVLFFSGNAPYQYQKDGELTGLAVEYFDDFARQVGLEYEAVAESDAARAAQMLRDGEVDLIACLPTDSDLAGEQLVRFSQPYVTSYAIRTFGQQTAGQEVPEQELDNTLDIEARLRQIRDEEGAYGWIDGYCLDYYLRKGDVYEGVLTNWADRRKCSYAVALSNALPGQEKLVSMLNQYIGSLTTQDVQGRLSDYLLDEVEYTPTEWVQAHRDTIALGAAIAALVMGACIAYISYQKIANRALVWENQLLYFSIHDELTGAYNRTYFCSEVEKLQAENKPVALVAMNIRQFRYLNDAFGAHRADRLLCRMKELLASGIHEGEMLCRPSDDSFYLALDDDSPETLVARLNEFQKQLRMVSRLFLNGYQMTVYCGVVSSRVRPEEISIQSSLNRLRVALDQAKRMGGGAICFYDDVMHEEDQLRQYIEANMERALAAGEFQVYFQPKRNLRTGQVDSAEALVRWQTRDRGLLSPAKFIPLFEQNGFCGQVDLYMLENVCQILRSWLDAGYAPITISVNQTKSLFISEDYPDKLMDTTRQYGIRPQWIMPEILEGLAFENFDQLNDIIDQLHQAGFRVSMDDFGSGYSSLNTLGKLHIDQVKLDRMFLMDVHKEQRGPQQEVMRMVFALARKLGMETVTEGVETQSDEEMVRSMGSAYGQGYYYSRPIPAEEFRRTYLKKADA